MDVIGFVNAGIIRIVKDGIVMDVPDDMGNLERLEIAEWEADGNTIPNAPSLKQEGDDGPT